MQKIAYIKNFFRTTIMVLALVVTPVTTWAAAVVDINRADAATMIENWKGIGEKKARAIIAYRNKNGKFSDVDDLANVKGIGEGIIKNNRKYMSVSKGVFKPTGKTTTSKSASSKKTDKKSTSKDSKTTKKSKSSSNTSKAKTSKSTSSKSTTSKSATKKKSSKKKKTKCKPNSKDKNCVKKSSKKKSTKNK